MREAGITHIFVDKINGYTVANLPELGFPIYANSDFEIYALPSTIP
jgi:hypothetical protein